MTSSITWTSQFEVRIESSSRLLSGDKMLLPPSALEQLLAAAPVITDNETRTANHNAPRFDPFNPYSYAAERHARAQTRYEHQQLPHPLTFRLVNPDSGRIVYAGIKEFSAEDGCAVISEFLAQALGIKPAPRSATPDSESNDPDGRSRPQSPSHSQMPKITVHFKQLPRGQFVKFRPLEAGYDPEDWKSLLEEHLRKNYTTLTKGEVLMLPARRDASGSTAPFQLLIDEFKPDTDGICVVDTDLEVDIEALNEDQARETLRQIHSRASRKPGSAEGSSAGGQLDLFRLQEGQVLPGEYVDYELPSWDRKAGVEIEMKPVHDEDELEIFASPFSNHQQAKPREDENMFSDYNGRPAKRLRLSPTNVELEHAEAVWISVYATPASGAENHSPRTYTIRAILPGAAPSASVANPPNGSLTLNDDEVICKNCLQHIPKRTLMLHENFCLRNNVLCPKGCGKVFQKRSDAWQNHWHCPHDSFWGDSPSSHEHHDHAFHEDHSCPNCNHIASSLPLLAHHRTSTCPGKLILCQFCHLVVPQEGDPDGALNAEALLSGLTPHELADGARTTECHICQRIVRLRDMTTHLKHHDLERLDRPAPRICRNIYCGRTQDGTSLSGDTRSGSRMGQGPGNDIGLCSTCFGPLYVSMYDPEGKALKRRVERRYLSQLLTGCGKSWCQNEYCKSGLQHTGSLPKGTAITTKDALPLIKTFLDGLNNGQKPLHFCVDEACQKRRTLAQMLAAEGKGVPGGKTYSLEWCVGALEAENGKPEQAMEWLKNFAPAFGENRS